MQTTVTFPECLSLTVNGERIHISHDSNALEFDPAEEGFRCVVTGHSHRPLVEERDGVLFVNPGSAGPRRFSLPITVGRIEIRGRAWRAGILPVPAPQKTMRP